MLLLRPLRADPPSNAQPVPKQDRIVGKAFMRIAESRDWEASLELMQADTAQGFLNIEVFAELLHCIRGICTERQISHLTMSDIEDVSQTWYRDFFRLAGFHRCRCPSPSAGSSIRQHSDQNRNCLSSYFSTSSTSTSSPFSFSFSSRRGLQDEEASLRRVSGTIRAWLAKGRCPSALNDEEATFSNVYERFKTWLAQGRCTSALLDSVASGKAADVEQKYFHDLLAEAGNASHSSTNAARKRTLQNRSNQAVEAVPRRTEPTSEGHQYRF